MVERNQSATEHLTERERTSSVAIVATQIRSVQTNTTSLTPRFRSSVSTLVQKPFLEGDLVLAIYAGHAVRSSWTRQIFSNKLQH